MSRYYCIAHVFRHGAADESGVLLTDGGFAPEANCIGFVDNIHRGRVMLYRPWLFDTHYRADKVRQLRFGNAPGYSVRVYRGPLP